MADPRDPRTYEPRWVVYPGERDDILGRNGERTTMGTIYMIKADRVVDHYDTACGPRVRYVDEGGHVAEPTPSGSYVLGHSERHTTTGWPASVIPWGARLRERADGVIEYQLGSEWVAATGPSGSVTRAQLEFRKRSHKPISPRLAEVQVRPAFFLDREQKQLRPTWELNDFGKWSWNLIEGGRRSVYFVHTTPRDELADSYDLQWHMEQSHGCLHIQPADRDEMVTKGYLKFGVRVQIMPYGVVGPPPETRAR